MEPGKVKGIGTKAEPELELGVQMEMGKERNLKEVLERFYEEY